MLPLKKILCPIDFSDPSLHALEAARELSLHFNAQLILLHVIAPLPATPTLNAAATVHTGPYQEALEESSMDALTDLIKRRIPPEVDAVPVVENGSPPDQIASACRTEGVDLIVMATHGHTGWRRFLFGSVAEKAVRLAPCPVLTIQPPQEEEVRAIGKAG
jgi:nucleotide-binding universal stress UspA family protein